MDKPVTIADVAHLAGVSVATVSRSLRDLPNVSPSTRQKVKDVAAELNYRPDPSASALAAGRTRTVAIALPLLDAWYFGQVMAGAEAVLTQAGYDVLMFTVTGDERRQRLLQGPLLKRADGLILVNVYVPPDEAADLVATDLAVATVGMGFQGASGVMVNDHRLASEAVEHLVTLGHTKIALLDGQPEDPERFTVPGERRRGYVDAMHAAGLHQRAEYVVSGGFSMNGGQEAMAQLLDLDDPPTATFAMSDEMALGGLRELWDRGLNAPDDMSIVGVDDHELADIVGLTTMQQEVARHGEIAAQIVLDRLDGGLDCQRVHMAEVKFLERDTTGPPPTAR